MKQRTPIRLICLLVALGLAVLLIPSLREPLLARITGEPVAGGHRLSYWIARLQDPDPSQRREAISAIGSMGSAGASAIPQLQEVILHDNIALRSWAITRGLGRIGEPAVPALAEWFKDRSVRTVVVTTMGDIGPRAVDCVPDLCRALDDESGWTRAMACNSLKKIGPSSRAAVPALLNTANDQSANVRYSALQALKAIDPGTVGVVELRSVAWIFP